MTDIEIDLKEMKEILKRMQEDIAKIELATSTPDTDLYDLNSYRVPCTQACSVSEELLNSYK